MFSTVIDSFFFNSLLVSSFSSFTGISFSIISWASFWSSSVSFPLFDWNCTDFLSISRKCSRNMLKALSTS